MEANRPVISSDLPVLREVLRDQYNCLLVAPDQAGEWENALQTLGEDEDLSKRISGNAYQDLLTKYTWKVRAEAIMDFIQQKEN